MDALVEAIQDVVTAEPETEVQPDPTQPDDGAIESQLTEQIRFLWTEHTRLNADRKATAKDLRQIRATLAERLHEMKSLLCQPDLGCASQWRGWLRQQGIPRSTADRLVARHAETLCGHDESVLSGAPSEPAKPTAEKLAETVWQTVKKVMTTGESVVQFIGCLAAASGIRHEWREEGLMIFSAVPEAADGLPVSTIAPHPADPVPQPSDEAAAIAEEPNGETAATPPEVGQTAAAAEAGNGDVQ